MHRRIKSEIKIISIILIFMISILFVGCFDISPVSSEVVEENNIIVNVAEIPSSLKCIKDSSYKESNIETSLFEGLVEITEGGKIAPALCRGWRVSEDGINYEFLLRDDAKWSNGEKITAIDFKEFFKALFVDTDFNNKDLYSIYGLEEYKKGAKSFDEVAIDATENILKIRLNKKDSDFLKKLTKPEYRLRKLSEPLDSYKEQYSSISYTGAYIIEKIDEEGNILLKPNKNYIIDRQNTEKVKITVGKNNEEDFANFALGKVDILANPVTTAFKEGNLKDDVKKTEGKRMTFMTMNTSYGVTSYLDFRKGIYSALNCSIVKSYMMDKGLGVINFKEISKDEIEENKVMNDYSIKEYDDNAIEINKNSAKGFFGNIPASVTKEIRIIGKDNFENKMITEFMKDELKQYNIKVVTKLCNEEEMEKELKEKKFNIYIEEIDLTKENIRDYINPLQGTHEDGYSIFSMYNKYNIWCKSNKIKKIYVDTNGNLILRKLEV